MNAEALHIVAGSNIGRSFPVDSEVILGRQVEGPGQIEGDPEISRRHARVKRMRDGQLVIEDLGSANGTYVNGVRVAEARVLRDGDAIRVGHTELELRADGTSATPAPGAPAAAAPPPEPGAAMATPQMPPPSAPPAPPAPQQTPPPPAPQQTPPPPTPQQTPPPAAQQAPPPPARQQPPAPARQQAPPPPPPAARQPPPPPAIPPTSPPAPSAPEPPRAQQQPQPHTPAPSARPADTPPAHAVPPPPPGTPAQQSFGVATLLHQGERIPLGPQGATAGRAEDSTLRIQTNLTSRHHARFVAAEGGYYVADLGSTNGTYLNGERLRSESRWLSNGDTVTVGGEPIRFLAGEATRLGGQIPQALITGTRTIQFDGSQLTLGRDQSNHVVLDDPNVSRFHAEVVAVNGAYELRDLGSRNGTRLNGQLIVERSPIEVGSEIGVGPFRLIFDGAAFVARDDRGSLRLAAEELTVDVKGKRILDGASVEVQPGEFVAIIGESGSGKTTMIKALAGVSHPTAGTVTVNGEPVASRLSEIGYVPQDEIVHRDLSVREALTYAARLRLPQDTTDPEIKAAVDSAMDELGLTQHAETRVGSLSGGQRKRAGVGTELVNRPGLLFLDEATTGLDPGLEKRMMQLMRDLANNARAVITITHATKNLGMCDKVAVMGSGGYLCFFGNPAEAMRWFGVSDYDGIYEALEDTPAEQWRQRWLADATHNGRAATAEHLPAQPAVARRKKVDRRLLPQATILAERYVRLIMRDRRNLLILLGQVPILAALVAALFHTPVFSHAAPHQSGQFTQLVFLLVTVVIWIGSIDAAREIIKERTVFAREHAVGVKLWAYLLSKTSVLFALAAIQTLILCAIVLGVRPLHEPTTTYLEVIALLIVTSWTAVGMGLALSAFVNKEDQATSFIPLALIPQLVLAGQIKPLKEMGSVLKGLATVIPSRWAFAGLGGTLHFNDRFNDAGQSGMGQLHSYGESFFKIGFGPTLGILAGFVAVFLVVVVLGLRRRTT